MVKHFAGYLGWKTIVASEKKRKAIDPNAIRNRPLKELPSVALNMLVDINGVFRLRPLPVAWKRAKPCKDRRLPQNHRPISLLSNRSKVAAQIILAKLCNDIPIPKKSSASAPDFA